MPWIAALRSGAANPASAHELGDRARVILARARDNVLSLITGAGEEGVTFTSGCTEANNTVFAGIEAATVITSTVEHPSVLRSAEWTASTGTTVHFVPVDRAGKVDLDQLANLVGSPFPETGTSITIDLKRQDVIIRHDRCVLVRKADVFGMAARSRQRLVEAERRATDGNNEDKVLVRL